MSLRKALLVCSACSILFSSVAMPSWAAKPETRVYRQYTRPYSRVKSSTVNEYLKISVFLRNQDYQGLKQAVQNGLSLEAQNSEGDTSVCMAVKRRDLNAFNMLKSLGADLSPSCMGKIPTNIKEAFIQNFHARGGYLSIADQDAMLRSAIDWKMVGLVGAGVVGAGAAVALAAGGGGGGGSSSGDSGNGGGGGGDSSSGLTPDTSPDNPSDTDPTHAASYLTREFLGTNFSSANNFLGQIKAEYAYASMASQSLPMAGQGVIVGVLDSGVDVDHRELKDNILKDNSGNVIGANFNYGPCRGSDRTSCWYYNSQNMTISFYESDGSIGFYSGMGFSDVLGWLEYDALFPADWDWDAHKNDPTPSSDSNSHGTHVAGIIAAAKDGYGMQGVAYNSKIIGIQLGLGWVLFDDDVINGFKYAVDNGASVLNNSWGNSSGEYISNDVTASQNLFNTTYGTSLKVAIEYAKNRDVVTVFAGGNDGDNGVHPQVSIESAAPMVIPSLLYYKDGTTLKAFTSYPVDTSQIVSSLFVSVVSVDSNNQLAYYSQQCGAASGWCISAPGGVQTAVDAGGIVSSTPGDTYDRMQGTSMAAPVVTGALATIMGAFPSLSSAEAVAILFETATDIGAVGVDDVFGWGLVNLQGAMNPVGGTSLAAGTSTTSGLTNFSGSRLTVPGTFARSLAAQLPEKILVLDKYRRGFGVTTGDFIRSTALSRQAFADDLRLFANGKAPMKITPSEKFDMRFAQNKSAFDTDTLNGMSFDMTYHVEDKMSVQFSFMQDAKQGFGNYFENALRNPFTTSATNLYSVQNAFKLTDDLSVSFGAGVGENNFFDGNEHRDYRHEDSVQNGSASLTYQPLKNVSFGLHSGILEEEGSLLGLSGSGAFETGNSRTYFMGATVTAEPIKRLQLGASYYYGNSRMSGVQNAFMRLSDVRSESMALDAKYALTDKTSIGVRGSSPLSVRSAEAVFDLPVARDSEEEIVYRERVKADLKAEAREWNVGFYGIHQYDSWRFQAQALARLNPDQQANKTPDYRLMFSVGFGY